MMMNNEEFDRFLHSRFAHHKMEPPPDSWNKISDRIGKRDRFAWWIIPAVLIAVLLPVGYFLFINQPSSSPAPSAGDDAPSVVESVFTDPQPTVSENASSPRSAPSASSFSQQPALASVTNKIPAQVPAAPNAPYALSAQPPVAEIPAHQTPYEEPVSQTGLIQTMSLANQDELLIVKMPKPEAPPSLVFNNMSMVLLAGPMVSTKHLESKRNLPGDERYARFRNDSEKGAGAWSAAFMIQFDLEKNYFIRTGIHFSNIRENIALRYIRTELNGFISDTIIGTKIPEGDAASVLSFTDEDDYKILADYILKDRAEYRFVSVPLMAGAGFSFKRFTVYATAGLALNYTTSYDGKILAPDSVYLFGIKNPATSPFTKVVGFTLMSSAGLGYKISDHYEFLIEPGYFYQWPDITKSAYRLSQRFSAFGIQSGLKVRF